MRDNSLIRYLLFGLLALLWIYGLYDLSHSEKQWDFKTYYYAAVAKAQGLDPYDTKVAEQLAGSQVKLSYVYPPLTLWFFRAFTVVNFDTAYLLYLILKVLALVVLLFLWRRYLFDGEDDLLFLWFVTLAYSSTVYWDFVSGNIGLFEQLFFWLAVIGFLRKKLLLFTAAIVLISFFKLTMIVFLALPLLWDWRKAIRYLIGGTAVFLVYLWANYLFAPAETNSFVSILRVIDERGEVYNHALLPMIKDLFDKSEAATFLNNIAGTVPILLYLCGIAVVAIISWRAYQSFAKFSKGSAAIEAIYLACLVYALAMPRMKSYSFILLLPATYHVLRKCVKPEAFLYLFIILSLTKWTPLPVPDFVRFLWWYFPWFAALLTWILYVRFLRQPDSVKN